MKHPIKNPALQSGAWIIHIKQQAFNEFKSYYTPLVSLCNTICKPCNTSVFQGNTKSTSFYKDGITGIAKYYKNLTNAKFQSIFVITTSNSGTNRTRQQAVFLRPLLGQLFKPIYGGLREGNTRPSGNILRRLFAVVIPATFTTGGDFTKRIGGHNYV